MSLAHGGHLTHGAKVNLSGKIFNALQYGVDANGLIDYEEVQRLASEHQPKMLIGGFSAYSQIVDWARMRQIADSVGAIFFVDMAHVAGLVAAGVYPSPLPHAHVVTSTTHKTMRGPRGGIVVARGAGAEIEKNLLSIGFPALPGGPLMQGDPAQAAALKEALAPDITPHHAQGGQHGQAVGEPDRQWHELRGLGGGVAEHDALVAGTLQIERVCVRSVSGLERRVHPLGDVGRLRSDGDLHAARGAVRHDARGVVATRRYGAPPDAGKGE